jgi:hypothetical protein
LESKNMKITIFKLPLSEEQLKQIELNAKKAGKTLIKYILDKCLQEDKKVAKPEVDNSKTFERTFKKAIKEIRKDSEE